jgi:hypothetical protein
VPGVGVSVVPGVTEGGVEVPELPSSVPGAAVIPRVSRVALLAEVAVLPILVRSGSGLAAAGWDVASVAAVAAAPPHPGSRTST